ncbi:transglutaminase-like cysteine peptidase [Devosia chinhatensis]|uniref:transglutaminase-like cysteine peptidase n=1 Tax=Devosia chinhatensis TaxID=429727 RepID=UPI0006964861|nr:transglutaminase-like cysteine peptidase [Devosia chinhatensis]
MSSLETFVTRTAPRLFGAAALALLLAGAAQASQGPRGAIPGSTIMTPLPMQFFCASNPRECVAGKDTKARWNDQLHKTLHQVNMQVNAAIRPQANPRGGWKINPASGDCNDYALTKRSRLIELGVPAGALRLAVTATRRGEKHLILVVKTTAGEVVLDNLSRNIVTLKDSGYAIHAMSGANPKRWIAG